MIQRTLGDPCTFTHADVTQLQQTIGNAAVARLLADMMRAANRTGLPEGLKAGIEHLSGLAMDDVRVHYNSPKPAAVQALAYTQGREIHLAQGQEQHLPHEAWHVVQQKQGRVEPTLQVKDVAINDDPVLEREADVWGTRALHGASASRRQPAHQTPAVSATAPVQRLVGFEIEAHHLPVTEGSSDAVKRVVNFLDGLPDSPLPPGGDVTWHRVYDTNSPLRRALNSEANEWKGKATVRKREIQKGPLAAIPEYVTEPFDERADDRYVTPAKWPLISTARTVYALADMAEAIDAIAGEIASLRQTAANSGNVQIGVPPLEDWVAAAEYFGIPEPAEFADQSRERIMALVSDDKNYVQATVGILPENITSFLGQAADQTNFNTSETNMPVSAADPAFRPTKQYNLLGIVMGLVDRQVHKLVFDEFTVAEGSAPRLSDDPEASEPLVAAGAGPLPTDDDQEKTALEGVLRLVLYMTTANMLWTTDLRIGGIAKNMVSFLPKTPLNDAVKALPYRVSPARLNTLIFAGNFRKVVSGVYDLHLAIGARVKDALGGEYPLSQAAIEGTVGSNLGTGSVYDYLWKVLSGSSDPAHTFLTKAVLGPEKPERGGRQGIATGNWFWQTQHTRPIVLELRHAVVTIPVNQLRTFADNIVKLVLKAHG